MALLKKKTIKKDTSITQSTGNKKTEIKKSFAHGEYLILKPYITEKSNDLIKNGQYFFRVAPFANKPEIKKAIENIYKVKVETVRIINTASKKRRFGRSIGKKSGYKKAMVDLKKGFSIELTPNASVGSKKEEK